MKKIILSIFILILGSKVFAQWTDSGSNLTTSDNVGIGTDSPLTELHVHGGGSKVLFGNPNSSSMPALQFFGGHSSGYSYIQTGGTASAKLRISSYQTQTTNLNDFQVYSAQTYFSGNLGIGTTSYSSKISVKSDQTKFITFERTGLSKKSHVGYGTNNEGGIYIGTDDSQYSLWVQQDGNVGINTYDPQSKLHIGGAGEQLIIGDNTSTSMPALKFWGGHSSGFAYLQAGGDAPAKLRITRYQSTSSNLDDLEIYSDQTYFSGNLGIGTQGTGTHKLVYRSINNDLFLCCYNYGTKQKRNLKD